MPWHEGFDDGLREGLTAAGQPFTLYVEFLDASRFPAGKQRELIDRLLREKYATLPVDILVGESLPAAHFLRSAPDLLPSARRIYIQTGEFGENGTAETIVAAANYRQSITEMLAVAKPKRIFVIGDNTAKPDKTRIMDFKAAFADVGGGLPAEYLSDLTTADLLARVSSLPPDSAIFMLPYFRGANDEPVSPKQAAGVISAAANAPMFSAWNTLLGNGVLGGSMISGRRVGLATARLIFGDPEPASSLIGSYYDWRQMQRWGISRDQIPEDAEILNYVPTLLESHGREIMAGAAFIALLLLLIAELIRRNRIQRQLRVIQAGYSAELETAVAERTVALEQARRDAEAASLVKSRFVASVSHELRTPLTGLLGGLDLAARRDTADRIREELVKARKSGEHLLNLVNKVLDFSKVEAGQIDLDAKPFDPEAVIERSRSIFHPQAAEKGLTLNISGTRAVDGWLVGDEQRIGQILFNLVGNAIKFTPSGQIDVHYDVALLDESSAHLSVVVRDTGPGLTETDQVRVFEDFTQINDGLSGDQSGTGLGLPIAAELARLMGGEIGVRSIAGQGSEFRFEVVLPRIDVPVQFANPDGDDQQALRPLNLLVVEDVAVNRIIVAEFLRSDHHRVDEAEDGRVCLDRLAEGNQYDAILMDIDMPRMNGLEATRHIRASHESWSSVPIIGLTANAFEQQVREYLAAGMNDCISKPVDWSHLRSVLYRTSAQEATTAAADVTAHPGADG